jgi:hypothetical protein
MILGGLELETPVFELFPYFLGSSGTGKLGDMEFTG